MRHIRDWGTHISHSCFIQLQQCAAGPQFFVCPRCRACGESGCLLLHVTWSLVMGDGVKVCAVTGQIGSRGVSMDWDLWDLWD